MVKGSIPGKCMLQQLSRRMSVNMWSDFYYCLPNDCHNPFCRVFIHLSSLMEGKKCGWNMSKNQKGQGKKLVNLSIILPCVLKLVQINSLKVLMRYLLKIILT